MTHSALLWRQVLVGGRRQRRGARGLGLGSCGFCSPVSGLTLERAPLGKESPRLRGGPPHLPPRAAQREACPRPLTGGAVQVGTRPRLCFSFSVVPRKPLCH